MQIIHVPDATKAQPRMDAGPISFVSYRDHGKPFRNRVQFNQYAFSFVQNGEKQIFRAAENVILKPGHGMLIPEGNSIIAEHSDNAQPYHSVIVFFPGSLGSEFVARHLPRLASTPSQAPYIHFTTTSYLFAYIQHIRQLVETGQTVSETVAQHKLEELLLVMSEVYPEQLASMFACDTHTSLKRLVENNLFSKLSLDELAFLSNRSLSSFKRDFEKAYGIPPQRYIRERKLELASEELAQGKSPSDLYLQYGYENLSNFNAAFKRQYGCSPGAYRNGLGQMNFLHQ
jgi:AraC-like DNA-binding protein